MNISFDLDGIFINTPPFIPKNIISWLYRENNQILHYRFPSNEEQVIRKMSHIPLFRPPIQKNIDALRDIKRHTKHRLLLLSGRFGFLKNETDLILKKYKLNTFFDKYCLNYENKQPHLFKNAMVKKYNIRKHVDDDLPLLRFLADNNKKTMFYWLTNSNESKIKQNIIPIQNIKEAFI